MLYIVYEKMAQINKLNLNSNNALTLAHWQEF